MPLRRRTPCSTPAIRRKITRRRARRLTWMDLIPEHSVLPSSFSNPAHDRPQRHFSENFHDTVEQPPTPRHSESLPYEPVETAPASAEAGQHLYLQFPEVDIDSADMLFSEAMYDLNEEDSETPFIQESEESTAIESLADIQTATPQLLTHIQREASLSLNIPNILAVAAVCGSVRFTVAQYEVLRFLLGTSNAKWACLPSYSTVRRKLFPHIRNQCFPRSLVKNLPFTGSNEEPHSHEQSPNTSLKEAAVRIVPPSEWAKVDIATPSVFNHMFPTPSTNNILCSSSDIFDRDSIERTPLVRNRASYVDVGRLLYVRDSYGWTPAREGDCISFQMSLPTSHFTINDLERHNYKAQSNGSSLSVNGVVCRTWCVGAPQNILASAKNAMDTLQGGQRAVAKRFSEARDDHIRRVIEKPRNQPRSRKRVQRFFTDSDVAISDVLPGDICTLLRPQEHEDDHLACVIVSRFWKVEEGIPSQFAIWTLVRKGEVSQNLVHDSVTFECRILSSEALSRAPVMLVRAETTSALEEGPYVLNRGTLEDGRPFLVYRVLLYCDDFKKSTSAYKQGSAGGVYFVPVGLPSKCRASRKAVRIISLTPPGVSTNEVLHEIVSDIIRATTTGVEGTTPDGTKVVIFLDIVGYIADYPASAGPIDVIGHTADSPCTHCNIRKLKNQSGSRMGHTTQVHGATSAGLRCAERHQALRDSNLSDADANLLGMSASRLVTDRKCPLLFLHRELENVRPHIPRTTEGRLVVPGRFDPYRSNFIAPDHLITGVSRNVLDLCFQQLPTSLRAQADVAICAALKGNGLVQQSSVYSVKNNQLHTMSLSSVYCVLLVATNVLPLLSRQCQKTSLREAIKLLALLQELVALTFWRCIPICDGMTSCALQDLENGRAYVAVLQSMADNYVYKADNYWKKYNDAGRVLDKPNLHRLLELYHHTLPAFNNVSHCMELVFETAHQPLKRCISKSNNHKAEVSAVEHCLGNDWQGRIVALEHLLRHSEGEQQQAVRRSLRRLLLGSVTDELNESTAEAKTVIEKMDRTIEKLFSAPLLYVLRSQGTVDPSLFKNSAEWKVWKQVREEEGAESRCLMWDVHELRRMGSRKLELLVGKLDGAQLYTCYETAKREKPSSTPGFRTAKPWDVLHTGDMMQALIKTGMETSPILRPQCREDSRLYYFVALGFLQGVGEGPWAVVLRTRKEPSGLIRTPKSVCGRDVQLLLMGNGVRRIAVYHNCNFPNVCRVERGTLIHGETLLSGGTFLVQGRKEGYPPRMG